MGRNESEQLDSTFPGTAQEQAALRASELLAEMRGKLKEDRKLVAAVGSKKRVLARHMETYVATAKETGSTHVEELTDLLMLAEAAFRACSIKADITPEVRSGLAKRLSRELEANLTVVPIRPLYAVPCTLYNGDISNELQAFEGLQESRKAIHGSICFFPVDPLGHLQELAEKEGFVVQAKPMGINGTDTVAPHTTGHTIHNLLNGNGTPGNEGNNSGKISLDALCVLRWHRPTPAALEREEGFASYVRTHPANKVSIKPRPAMPGTILDEPEFRVYLKENPDQRETFSALVGSDSHPRNAMRRIMFADKSGEPER